MARRKSTSRAAATKTDLKPMAQKQMKGAMVGTKGSGQVMKSMTPAECAKVGDCSMKY